MAAEHLVCPLCRREHPASERFCASCAVPLIHADAAGGGDAGGDRWTLEQQERARKVTPGYTEGELVKVVRAGSQVEAEFIQGLLLEEGVPSLLRRSRGFDVPDFMAAGPRDVMVPESGVVAARDVLLQSELIGVAPPSGSAAGAWRVMLALLAGLIVLALIVLVHPY